MQYKSALMTEATGHIDGLVASHNRWGHYFRPRVTPVNPNSQRQSDLRSNFSNCVQLWQDITNDQRADWKQFADNTPQKNRLGQDIILTGQNAFVKANSAMLLAGEAPVYDAPTEYNNGQAVSYQPDSFVFDPDTGQWQFTVERDDEESLAGNVLTFRGQAQNPSRNFYGGPYQLSDITAIDAVDVDEVITATIGTDDLCDFAIPTLEVKVPWRIRVVYADGRLSHDEIFILLPELTTTTWI